MTEQTNPAPGLMTSTAPRRPLNDAEMREEMRRTAKELIGIIVDERECYWLGLAATLLIYAAAAGPPRDHRQLIERLLATGHADKCASQERRDPHACDCGYSLRLDAAAALAAAPPAASAEGEPVTVWRHYKGGMYERIRGVLRESDAQTLVLYRSCETGAHWVRPIREFEEKFTRVDAVPLRKRPASAAPKAEPHADEDGACTRCGLRFQEEDCTDPHECPPGFNPPTPDDGRSDAELLQRLDEWPKSLAVPPTGLTMTLRTPSVQHEAAARLRELLAEREHTGERIERAVTAALSGDYIGVVTALSGTDALLAPAKTGGGNG